MTTHTKASMAPDSSRPGRWTGRADRDLMQQINQVRRFVAALPPLETFTAPCRRLFAPDEMRRQIDWAGRLSGDGGRMVRGRLERAQELGEMRLVAQAPAPDGLAELAVRFPNFQGVTAFVQRHLALCRHAPERVLRLPPMLLTGAPGVGKTAYASALAHRLGVPVVAVGVSTLTAGHSLAGLDASYESAKPGLVWDALDTLHMSPIVLLDEIDKPPHGRDFALGSLYPLLERHTARRFVDQALLLPVNAEHILWVATCNDLQMVEPALRSRFEVIEVQAPTAAQMPAVVASVQRQLIDESDWSDAFEHRLDADVMAALEAHTPREVRRVLEDGYAHAACAGRKVLTVADIEKPRNGTSRSIGFSN